MEQRSKRGNDNNWRKGEIASKDLEHDREKNNNNQLQGCQRKEKAELATLIRTDNRHGEKTGKSLKANGEGKQAARSLDKDALRGAGQGKPPACAVSRRSAFLHPEDLNLLTTISGAYPHTITQCR